MRPACIQDAFFSLLARWFEERGERPSFYNVAWDERRPSKELAALMAAEWVFLFSSNEFTFHSSGVVNPLFVKSSNAGIERLKPVLQGKRIVVFSMDALDTEALVLDRALAGVDFRERHFISETDFPLTVQSVRYNQLRKYRGQAERCRDFAYWGTTKARSPEGGASGDVRLPVLRALLRSRRLSFVLFGNHFGPVKAQKFNTSLPEIAPELAQARATACFQWPGHGGKLTARYHEAMALGLLPMVHDGYDTERQVALEWQRFGCAEHLAVAIEDMRAPRRFAAAFAEVERHYLKRTPSDDEQYRLLARRLKSIGAGKMTALAGWQQGFELEHLRAFAAVFKERHKPLVFGAFGLTKERDIAEALAKKRLVWTGTPPEAVAIFSVTQKPSEQEDFAQRPFTILPGSVYVKSFAARSEQAGTKILDNICQRAKTGSAQVVVEAFEEDSIARQCLKRAGLRWQTSKISAGSEIKGVYSAESLGMEALQPCDLATLSVLRRDFLSVSEHSAILKEAEDHVAEFAQHYSDYNKRKSWTAFAVHGYSDDPAFIIKPGEMARSWKEENAGLMKEPVRWTKAAKHFPVTRKVAERLGAKLDRVRFMRLRSKDGELSRHADITDREAGTADGFVTRLHIPIRTSADVMFYGWDARGQQMTTSFPERALCYLDQRKPHAVKNTDPSLDRIHLVVDCFADAKVRELISRSVTKLKQAA
jgi:hypothetical protein